jgi:hydrogenase maturation protease
LHLVLGARLESRAQVKQVSMEGSAGASASLHQGETLILGVGNPLYGDDGAGPRLVEMLAERNLPPNVQVQDAGLPGWGLPSWLEGWETVFLVDAVDMGLEAGSWRRFRPEEVKLWLQDGELSLHQPDLACGLALAQALDLLPEQLVLYGVQPGQTDPGAPLSQQVSASLRGLADQIIFDAR